MFQKEIKQSHKIRQKKNESDYSHRKGAGQTTEYLEPFGPSTQRAAAVVPTCMGTSVKKHTV